jgi:hypothetical protein
MRQHELSFANFILRFGIESALLDYAEEIVLPAFLQNEEVRTFGDTTYRFYNVSLVQMERDDGIPILVLSGHFIKDTILRRQQIFDPSEGIVEDAAQIASAPSAYFILQLNNHRLLYFAESANAPSLESFGSTVQHFVRQKWHTFVREEKSRLNVTRRNVERLTVKDMQKRIPTPVVTVVKVAGRDEIAETIDRFKKITSLRIDLIQPNEETDGLKAVSSVEEFLRPVDPDRLFISATKSAGLEKPETKVAVEELTSGQNTHLTLTGLDDSDAKIKADNDEFALSVAVEDPPQEDAALRQKLWKIYKGLVDAGKVFRPATPIKALDVIKRLRDNLP